MLYIVGTTRKPLFWISLIILSLASIIFSWNYFSTAFPIVNIDLTIDRLGSLKKAATLAKKFNWGPIHHDQSASFNIDQTTKIFVELEGGGKKEFIKMMKENLYMPYTWSIRNFREFDINETIIYLTPSGNFYGFIESLSENEPGASIELEKARTIAETWATEHGRIQLSEYKLVESSNELKSSGRMDHEFIYERLNKKIGENGFYRLKITVSGDKVTGLNHFIKIPEDFINRYKEIRATNNSIAFAAYIAFILLYFVIGCVLGLLFLMRKHFLIWRTPFIVGICLAFLKLIVDFNQLPIIWTLYDTALSKNNFLLGYFIHSLTGFFAHLFLYTIIAMAGEGLSRKAFGNHIQFWRIWSKDVANTTAILGRTVGGYIFASLQIFLVVITYMIATKFLGWWTPTDEMVDPNILAHHVPALSAIQKSLSAGFLEEFLFRAVPIAGATIIGKKYGNLKWWIGGALIIQAIIFGAAHATYLTQPAYARLVEQIIPSLLFGFVYLIFGLLPVILAHFVYDIVWFSIPIFASSSSVTLPHKLLVVIITFIPLWIILFYRIYNKSWTTISDIYLNKSWLPKKKQSVSITQTTQKTTHLNSLTRNVALIGGLTGLIAWAMFTPFKHDATSLTISKKDAIEKARQVLDANGIKTLPHWSILTILASDQNVSLQHKFIWQLDKSLYKNLLGEYLDNPQWIIRFVTFEGSVTERSEEYRVHIDTDGRIVKIYHKIPEVSAGENLTQEQARTIAYEQLSKKLKLDPKKIKEISAITEKLPNRTNWLFTFENKEIYPFDKGQARIAVQIDGNKVTDITRYIHVPENWERNEKNKQTFFGIFSKICSLFLIGIFIFALFMCGTRFFSLRVTIRTFFVILTLIIVNTINQFPNNISRFNTSEPFYNQLFIEIGLMVINIFLLASLVSLVFGLVLNWKTPIQLKKSFSYGLYAIGICTLFIGVYSLINYTLKPSLKALWPYYNNFSSYIPSLDIITQHIMTYFLYTGIFLLSYATIDALSHHWQKNKILSTLLFLMAFMASTGLLEIESISFWMISSITLGLIALLLYVFIIRLDHSIIPIVIACYLISQNIQQSAFNAFPQIRSSTISSSAIIFLLALIWFKKLNR